MLRVGKSIQAETAGFLLQQHTDSTRDMSLEWIEKGLEAWYIFLKFCETPIQFMYHYEV